MSNKDIYTRYQVQIAQKAKQQSYSSWIFNFFIQSIHFLTFFSGDNDFKSKSYFYPFISTKKLFHLHNQSQPNGGLTRIQSPVQVSSSSSKPSSINLRSASKLYFSAQAYLKHQRTKFEGRNFHHCNLAIKRSQVVLIPRSTARYLFFFHSCVSYKLGHQFQCI